MKKVMIYYQNDRNSKIRLPEGERTQIAPETSPPQPQICECETNYDLDRLARSPANQNIGTDCQNLQAIERFASFLDRQWHNLDELLQAIADAAVSAIASAEFAIALIPEGDGTRCKFSDLRSEENSDPNPILLVRDKLLSERFAAGEFQLLRRESATASGYLEAAVSAVAIESSENRGLGILAIGSWESDKAVGGSTQRLLSVMAKQAAIAIDRMRAIVNLQQQEELLDLQNQLLARQRQEIENQRQQIHLQNLQLLEAAQLKSQFLNTVSHELRTPMNAIIGFSQLLLRQQKQLLTQQQKDMVARIFHNGKNLLVLINDILDLSNIETGRAELAIEEFDLASLVISVALEFGSRVNEKNLAMSVSACLQNQYIVNDKSRLRQVLVNLISNAVKFTHQGSICIQVRELSGDRLAIVVEDTGIGISETEQQRIFDKFHQADGTTTRQYPGTGLGLAITASLLKMMNGTISVISRLGEGSRFTIELPRKT